MSRTWVIEAIAKIERDFARSADTHLMPLQIPGAPGITVYLKDETTHVTGSLKHRLARSLFLHALCSGLIDEGTTIVEASSGSTAISEAYFARLLGLPFVAVVPRDTACAKIEAIRFYGGTCHFVDEPGAVYDTAQRLADGCNGHYMDQFTNAAMATDWRGNNNIAESIFRQMQKEAHPVPEWIVVGAGTGGTSATIGRFVRYAGLETKVCVVDPERSVFYESFYGPNAEPSYEQCPGTCIEGIGRPRLEPSFIPQVVDRMIRVPNAASFAASLFLDTRIRRRYGGSTGTNLYGVLEIAAELHQQGIEGSIVTLACDGGERYADTLYDPGWLSGHHVDVAPYLEQIHTFFETGQWRPVVRATAHA